MRDVSKSLVRRAYMAFLDELDNKPKSMLDQLLGQQSKSTKSALPKSKGMMAKKHQYKKSAKEDASEGMEHIQYARKIRQLRLTRKSMMGEKGNSSNG